ncbi:hypothetical protein IKR55_00315 [bacterium]|nr:hypothetical protein [Elusimicrobiota bacterium]MBR6301159.1 hypothetical protein [bacterium]
MEFLNSKNNLYLGGAVNQIDALSGIEYLCSSDPTQSDVPLSDYLTANNGRVQNLSGFIARVGLYNYTMQLTWEFTDAKSEYTTGEFWNIMSATGTGYDRPFVGICKFGFASVYRDAKAGGIYPGLLTFQGGTKYSIPILPFVNIVIADLESLQDKRFETTAFWTSF